MSPRAYRSPHREQVAAHTRNRIAQEARALFLREGFRDTSVAKIARAAGVSAQTVHAHFGTKTGIVTALVTELEQGAGVEEAHRAVESAPNGMDRLRAWAEWTVAMLAPARELRAVMREAAAEPPMQEIKRVGDEHRRAGVAALAKLMSERGELAPTLTVDEAADQLWIMCSLEVYLLAVDCGWDDAQITEWLAATLIARLLA